MLSWRATGGRYNLAGEGWPMWYAVGANIVVAAHFAFILFVVGGGLLVVRWRRLIWLHLPAAAWGTFIELSGGVCPLTPLENWLRGRAGGAGYEEGFIEHYLLPIIYPPGLTTGVQVAAGALVVAANVVVYGLVWSRRRLRAS